VTYDNGNVTTGSESTYDGFKNSAPYIVHAHFKDFKVVPEGMLGLDGKCRKGEMVGDGDVDQLGGLRAMKECGYSGYINFEYEGSEMTPRDATVVGVRRMRQWIASPA
jgi:sugar phosphate isomerase/epimerase